MNVENAITRVAAANGIPREPLARMVHNESNGNRFVGWDKITHHSTVGITQISPLVWGKYGNKQPYSFIVNPDNFEAEMDASAKFLKVLHKEYHTWKLALEGYNEGETVMNQVVHGERDLAPTAARYGSGEPN